MNRVELLQQIMLEKKAETMGTNMAQPAHGETSLYPDPQGYTPPSSEPEDDHGKAALEEVLKTRGKLLDQNFDSMTPASKTDKALISQLFEAREYESHSPLLAKKASPTLSEQVRRLFK